MQQECPCDFFTFQPSHEEFEERREEWTDVYEVYEVYEHFHPESVCGSAKLVQTV